MKRSVSDGAILGAILKKDLRLYGRNKVYLFLTMLTIALFALIFWIIPDTVDETINIAVSPPVEVMIEDARNTLREMGIPESQIALLDQAAFSTEEEGLALVELANEEQLRKVIEGKLDVYRIADGSLVLIDAGSVEKKPAGGNKVSPGIGIGFPESFIADMALGIKSTVTVYSDAAVPDEIRSAMESFVRELAFQIAGRELPVEMPAEETIILGRDRLGEQPSMREKMRPMIAFFVLMVEMFAMASLISIEVLQRTVTALMVTPMKVWHFLTAKTIFGTAMALGQGLIILALVGTFTPANWPLLIVTILIGSLLFTGLAMLIGAAGKDFIDQLMYAVLFMVPLMIPSFTVLFPGSAAAWVRALPSYPVIDLLVGVTIYDAGWAESIGPLAYALLWVVVLFGAGLFVLKRKVESL